MCWLTCSGYGLNMKLRHEAEAILKEAYGVNARFREGQLEAIEATLTNKRTLIVQKTGWGKSLIYFIATKILRSKGGGTTLIISPLLELMNNQIEAASIFGLHCEMLNSTIKDEADRLQILDDLQMGRVDVLFITPETLFKVEVQARIADIQLGLFVIDEAHCLSDWGHDFRREYSRLYRVINILPSTTPVLCTTATANNRVIEDLSTHLGEDLYVSKGELMRESLCLQIINSRDKAARYAWILEHLNDLPGTGIIYCLTRRECQDLSDFLKHNGIAAEAYYSDNIRESSGLNADAIMKFKDNRIKAIVATIKLGMGYDKPDIGFVIHYQRPQNIVAYYQQIGRAGRNLDKSYAILMTGPEDEDILNYFIDNAFPDEEMCERILKVAVGKSKNEIIASVNGPLRRIENALVFLEFDGYLQKEGSKYYRNPMPFQYDREHYEAVTAMRKKEMKQMRDLLFIEECLLRFTVNCLNDSTMTDCRKCENCIGEPLIPESFSEEALFKAQEYIKSLVFVIEPRRRWACTQDVGQKNIEHPFKPGLCLSKYGDAGYGEMVKHDKYKADKYRDELLNISIEKLNPIKAEYNVQFLTFVPSLRNDKVEKFARKLAKALELEFIKVIQKSEAPQQKDMQNSSFQYQNAQQSFSIPGEEKFEGSIILVDDIVDSRWTLTVCGNLLGKHGFENVIPFCLADSSGGESND